jgi:hypothetical protein
MGRGNLPLRLRRAGLLAVVIACMLGGIWLAWSWFHGEGSRGLPVGTAIRTNSSSPKPATSVSLASAPSFEGSASGHAERASRLPALPPLESKIVVILPMLRQLASEGSANAACRLGYELYRCRRLPDLRVGATNAGQRVAMGKASGVPVDQLMRHEERVRRQVELDGNACDGLPLSETADGWRYTLAAAQSGYAPAIMQFVNRVGLDQANPASTAEGWVAYKDYAPGLLQAALDKGVPAAYEFAAAQHSWPDERRRIVPYDPVRSIAITLALRKLAADSYAPKAQANLDYYMQKAGTADFEKAERDSQEILARLSRFNNGPIDGTMPEDGASYCAGEQ